MKKPKNFKHLSFYQFSPLKSDICLRTTRQVAADHWWFGDHRLRTAVLKDMSTRSGGVSWVLLRPTSEIFAVPPRAPEVAVHSAHRNRGYSLFLLLVHPQPRPVHSRWLAPLCGMGFDLCRKDCSQDSL